MDIRLCDDGDFDKYLEIVKRQKVGLEFQTFTDPRLKNIKKQIAYQKEQTKNFIIGKIIIKNAPRGRFILLRSIAFSQRT